VIQIKLKDDFLSNKDIKYIFNSLSNKILEKANELDITLECIYKEQTIKMDTKETIQNFLMAQDFYNYHFNYDEDAFILDLKKLHDNIKIDSLKNPKNTKSVPVHDFVKKYKGTTELNKIISSLEFNENDRLNKETKTKIVKALFPEYIDMLQCFDYGFLSDDQRHKLINNIGLRVCPYCNMNYIINYIFEKKEKSTGDLDHFYYKNKYKEYSLCLFNFIPSCPICNSRFKLAVDMKRNEYTYPYEDSFEEKAKFQIVNLVEAIVVDKIPIIKLNIYNDDSEKVSNSIKIFKTDELYKTHVDYAKQLLQKSMIYNDAYIEDLYKNNSNLFASIDEVKYLIFGTRLEEGDIANISLGKLRMDLLQQLQIY
jgi:hypothetical protein